MADVTIRATKNGPYLVRGPIELLDTTGNKITIEQETIALCREEEYEMDLWVVKYASRRSRIGDFSGDSSVRGARIRGVLASQASAG
jgi:hypothetical protein